MSYVLLDLDTTAPVVTWGPVTGAVASEELTAPYTLDEPSLISATVTLADARVLPMVVAADRLTVLPPRRHAGGRGHHRRPGP
jgi:hypothetical protein